MHLRFNLLFILLLMFTCSAYGTETPSGAENPLIQAAAQMKLKNYSAAVRLAAESPENGQRLLLMGMAELRRGRYDEAEKLLGKAAKGYPLLADYALYYQAAATVKAGRSAEAVLVLKALQKGYPDTPLYKRSLLLEADTLFENGQCEAAEPLYMKFIEQYPTGSDALQSSYRLAVCREKRGDESGAAALLRSLWLNSPASTQAAQAEADLMRLDAGGVAIKPYTAQELFKRAATLYDQRHYEQAAEAFSAISTKDEKREFIDRVALKTAQALLKARQYQEAEKLLKELSLADTKAEVRSEASYLLARAIEKSGRSEEAFAAYNAVATAFPDSAEADNALLDAAFIRKFQYRPKETAELLDKLLAAYPKTVLKQRITWESGWANYLAGNMSVAAGQFSKLLDSGEYRERALFWHGRAAAAAGDSPAAEASYSQLAKEFPFGFYALSLQKDKNEEPAGAVPALTGVSPELLPLPEGYERVRGLIALGLVADAATELAASRKKLAKVKGDAGLARLYLELGNYNAAMGLFDPSMLQRPPQSALAWSFLYPKAFAGLVVSHSEKAGIEPSLAFAVMKAESSFSPMATSPVGARGLMQLMPATAAMLLQEKKLSPERLYDPELNIRLGTRYLRDMMDKYGGNKEAVIASYNAGAANVNRWLKTYSNLAGAEFIESIPFAETRDYVKKVLTVAALYKRLYGIK